MAKFLIRRLFSLILTMLLVSVTVYLFCEVSPGNIARNVLGTHITERQEESFLNQLGMDEPLYVRYMYWLFGSDWHASRLVGMPLKRILNKKGFHEWWAVKEDGSLIRWKLDGEDLIAVAKSSDGIIEKFVDNGRWKATNEDVSTFWGIDTKNHVVQWEKGAEIIVWTYRRGGWQKSTGGPKQYIPLKKGLIRGDPGVSLITGRAVSITLFTRFRNSVILAGLAFIIVMPFALLLGIFAGLNEGSTGDRVISICGMAFSVVPEFVTGIFLIVVLSLWLRLLPGATIFPESAPWKRIDMLILPLLTLALVELGYILRITRASLVEVMDSSYVRTAFLKGLPYWRVVFTHAVRNAMIAPITVIMLHTRYLVGGLVVVEVVFSYPGLGTYLLDAALYRDVNALEAGTMLMVIVCVGAQVVADIIYTFVNPRIRYT
ncbi:MAG: ABC transporter permease [Thermodesulfobacteriota bacterium]